MTTPAERPVPCLLALHGPPDAARRWLRGGLVESVLAPTDGDWQLCAPAPGSTQDDRTVFLNRPVPRRLAPAIGFLRVRETALVVVTPARLRPTARWIAWRPGIGVIDAAPLEQAGPADLLEAAGLSALQERDALLAVLRDELGDAESLLEDLCVVLGLPGHDVIAGRQRLSELHGAEGVAVDGRAREVFAELVEEEHWWREELAAPAPGGPSRGRSGPDALPPAPPSRTGLPRVRNPLRPKEKP